MDFVRLRLSGFKSFVDSAELNIEPGLTGIVGPNGCGKSNLLEAMRWVMGAASAKAMRGEGMDDVIFAGADSRPSRSHAEVTLTIDNADGDAPGAFRSDPVVEVTRRIDRGEGSTFRVNGREVRARDVQILFADAATGANSPALVRQGQISELISARPQNRRLILEEAAGVTGLHGRRHEAELRVSAAATNLERLDDLARELETSLARLRRDARQASRYKALSAEIRALHESLIRRRWVEARSAADRVSAQAAAAQLEFETSVRSAATATTAALTAEGAIRPLRDEDAAATAVLARMALEKDRLDRDLAFAQSESARLAGELERLAEDDAREAERLDDARNSEARLSAEIAELQRQVDETQGRSPKLQAQAGSAQAARAKADTEVEDLASAVAAADAHTRAASDRLAEVEDRLSRTQAALARAVSELESLAAESASAGCVAARSGERENEILTAARSELEASEIALGQALADEALARQAARSAEDELAVAATEARALASLTASTIAGVFAPILDAVAPQAGFEAALAAALGDELEAALDAGAPSFWAGAVARPPAWPKGVTPLGEVVAAPAQLAARLAFTGLVAASLGEELQTRLPPGTRLVSREGDLWRWDGFTVRAAAPRPARVRLEQKTRLASLETVIAKLHPVSEAARSGHLRCAAAVSSAEGRRAEARRACAHAEAELAQAHTAEARRMEVVAAREARASSLAGVRQRLEVEAKEVEQAVEARTAELRQTRVERGLVERLQAARIVAATARDAESSARVALDAELRDREGRVRRLAALTAERSEWGHRAEVARRRRDVLANAREEAAVALTTAQAAPETTQAQMSRLLDELASAETRKARSADTLTLAESAKSEADRVARAAEAHTADSRERRATLDARNEAARERLAEQARALGEISGLDADDVEARFGPEIDAAAAVEDIGAVESRLARLERERDAAGPVNLRAEEEAAELAARVAELASERADLAGALGKLRQAVGELNAEGRTRLLAAFEQIHGHFRDLFVTLFQGGHAELRLVESDDPLEAGLEVLACPPGKRMAVMSLMSGGEQALTAMALIFAVFLSKPAPLCVLDEADAPLDDSNVERFCNLLAAMRTRSSTRYLVITHNALTMSRMDRLYGVTMREPGVSQLVSVDLHQAERMAAQ